MYTYRSPAYCDYGITNKLLYYKQNKSHKAYIETLLVSYIQCQVQCNSVPYRNRHLLADHLLYRTNFLKHNVFSNLTHTPDIRQLLLDRPDKRVSTIYACLVHYGLVWLELKLRCSITLVNDTMLILIKRLIHIQLHCYSRIAFLFVDWEYIGLTHTKPRFRVPIERPIVFTQNGVCQAHKRLVPFLTYGMGYPRIERMAFRTPRGRSTTEPQQLWIVMLFLLLRFLCLKLCLYHRLTSNKFLRVAILSQEPNISKGVHSVRIITFSIQIQ